VFKKVPINMGPTLTGHGAKGVFFSSHKHTLVNCM
jgi:hypothetical protein